MAEIRQELQLEDKFTRVLEDYIKRMEKVEEITQKLYENQEEANDTADKLDRQFNRLNSTAERLANNGLSKVIRRLAQIGTAYLGFNALRRAVVESMQDFDLDIRMTNRHGEGQNIVEYGRGLATKYGGRSQDYNRITSQMSTFANGQSIDRMYQLASKLASINPNMTVTQAASTLTSNLDNRSGSGIISAFGLEKSYQNNTLLNRYLQTGQLEKALDMIEQLGKKAGATEESVARMLDSPTMKLERFSSMLNELRLTIGYELLQAFNPVIDALMRIFNSEIVQKWIGYVVGLFRWLGQTVGDILTKIANNLDEFEKKMKGVIDKIATLFGFLITYKVLVLGIGGAYKALKFAIDLATSAQMLLNGAMLANPIGIVVAGILAAIAVLTALNKHFNDDLSWFQAFIKTLVDVGVAIANIFIMMANSIGPVIAGILNILASLGDMLLNLQNLPFGLANVFVTAFLEILKITNKVGETIGWLAKKLGEIAKIEWLADAGASLEDRMKSERGSINEMQSKWNDFLVENGFTPSGKLEYKELAFLDSNEIFKKILDALNGNVELAKKAADYLSAGNKKMEAIASAIDPHSWMDGFSEFAVEDAERRAVVQANQQIDAPITFTFAGNMDGVSKEEVARMVTEALDKWGRKLQDTLQTRPKEGQAK